MKLLKRPLCTRTRDTSRRPGGREPTVVVSFAFSECACSRLRPVPAGARILRRMIASRYGCNARPPWRQPGRGTRGNPGRTRGVAFLRSRSFLCMLHGVAGVEIASYGDAPDRDPSADRGRVHGSGGGLLRSRRSRPHGRAVWQKLAKVNRRGSAGSISGDCQRAVFTGTGKARQ